MTGGLRLTVVGLTTAVAFFDVVAVVVVREGAAGALTAFCAVVASAGARITLAACCFAELAGRLAEAFFLFALTCLAARAGVAVSGCAVPPLALAGGASASPAETGSPARPTSGVETRLVALASAAASRRPRSPAE